MQRLCRSVVFVVGATISTSSALGLTQVTENFNSAPANWIENGSRSAPQNFGFSATGNAGGIASGEAGGQFGRLTLGRYDTSVGSLDPSTDLLTMSGRIVFTTADCNAQLGWYDDSTSLAFRPANFVGIRCDSRNLRAFFRGNGGNQVDMDMGAGALTQGTSAAFTVTYDPNANGGLGAISGVVNGVNVGPFNLAAGAKDAMTNANRFGMFSLFNGGSNTGSAFFDDLNYTSNAVVPEPASVGVLGVAVMPLLWRRRR